MDFKIPLRQGLNQNKIKNMVKSRASKKSHLSSCFSSEHSDQKMRHQADAIEQLLSCLKSCSKNAQTHDANNVMCLYSIFVSFS